MTGALLALCVLLPAGVLAAIIAALVVRSSRRPALRWVEVRSVRLPASDVELFSEARHALDSEVESGSNGALAPGCGNSGPGALGGVKRLTCPVSGGPCPTPQLCRARGCPLEPE